jgi:hypothetical protein
MAHPWAREGGVLSYFHQLARPVMFPKAREALLWDWRWRIAEVSLGVLVVMIALQATGLVDIAGRIRDYQLLIGTLVGITAAGGVGFWSVTATLRANAEATLAQREREIEHERVGARAMILAELMVMHDSLSTMHQVCMEGRKRNNFTVPKFMGGSELFQGYRGQIAKVGLLPKDQLLSVVWAYATQEGVYSNWKWMEQLQDAYDTSKLNQPHEVFITGLNTLLRRVETAIVALGGEVMPRNRTSLGVSEPTGPSALAGPEDRSHAPVERRVIAMAK